MALSPLRLVQNSTASNSRPGGPTPTRDLGMILQAMGLLSVDDLLLAKTAAAQQAFTLNKYLLASGMIADTDLLQAQARATSARIVDLKRQPPDPRLIDQFGASRCIKHTIVPWKSIGGAILVACQDPDDLIGLTINNQPLLPVLATGQNIRDAVARCRGKHLARRAEVRTDEDFSCRNWPVGKNRATFTFILLVAVSWSILGTASFSSAFLGWTLLTMFMLFGLKIATALLHLFLGPIREPDQTSVVPIGRRPEVSVIVALFKEKEIASRLVERLSKLTYAKELLEIVLVVEASDHATRNVLAKTDLPHWFKIVVVPKGTIKTKPRALNYALDFCTGQIIGVYDAEDAPDPDQIDKIVDRFLKRGDDVACLQGRLDYYNPRANWLSRCFTIEYATWFRIVLPGLQRMGWPVPLGGTTLFFRRAALEELGAWDAHNVTEDADLGMRLARFGYRTELVDTVTYEEANCRLWPWIKQRSRWLKGYAVTYWVHMQSPKRLLRDLGLWRFIGFQTLFLGTLTQIAFAPILWCFWPAAFGLWHPFHTVYSPQTIGFFALLFVGAELVSMTISGLAVATRDKRHLIVWIPTLMGYFPFATIAAFKGLLELPGRPFYWDKTTHGISQPTQQGE